MATPRFTCQTDRSELLDFRAANNKWQIVHGTVASYLRQLPGVIAIHDLHVWAMSTTETAFSCHLVMPNGHPGDEFLREAYHQLHNRFEIAHPTLQIELGDVGVCKLEPQHVV